MYAKCNVLMFAVHIVLLFVRRRLTMFVFNTQTHCYGVFDLLNFCAMFATMFAMFL